MSDDEGSGDTAILLERPLASAPAAVQNVQNGHPGSGDGGGRAIFQSRVVVFASIVAAIGGLLFGYDVGIISGALLQLEREWSLDCWQQQMVVSLMLVGALAASCVGGLVVDKIGRKWTIILNSVVFVVGATVLTLSYSVPVLMSGRVIVGFAVSLSAISECIYISEIAPPDKRGMLVGLNELGITIGFLLAYTMNYVFADIPNGWRYMFIASAVPAIIQMLGMFRLPPSPHYLILRKKDHKAEKVLSDLRGKPDVRQELTNIRIALDAERDQSCWELFSKKDMKYRMLVATGLVLFQQFTGQPNVLYYASVIFKSAGFCSEKDATFASVILGIIKLGATVVSMLLVDKAGRRVFLVLGAVLMAISITGLGAVAYVYPQQFQIGLCSDRSQMAMTATTTVATPVGNHSVAIQNFHMFPEKLIADDGIQLCPSDDDGFLHDQYSNVAKWCSLTFLMIYVASYSVGFGPVTWLVLSEIFPTSIKGRAVAASSVLNWGANILISATFLDVTNYISVGTTFVVYGVLCIFSVVFVLLVIPETKNKSLTQLVKEIEQINPNKKIAENLHQMSCCHCCLVQHYRPLSRETNLDDVPFVEETTA